MTGTEAILSALMEDSKLVEEGERLWRYADNRLRSAFGTLGLHSSARGDADRIGQALMEADAQQMETLRFIYKIKGSW